LQLRLIGQKRRTRDAIAVVGRQPYAPGLGTVGRGLGRHLCVMRAQPKLNLGPILLYLFYLLPV